MDVTGLEHAARLVFPVPWRQSPLDSVLAIPEDLGVVSIHSKWPFVGCLFLSTTTFQPMFTGISSLFVFSTQKSRLLHD
jgi:hypothetical protein